MISCERNYHCRCSVELDILIGWPFRGAGYLKEVIVYGDSLQCGYDSKADYFPLKVLNKQEWLVVKSETYQESETLSKMVKTSR